MENRGFEPTNKGATCALPLGYAHIWQYTTEIAVEYYDSFYHQQCYM